MNAPTQTVPTAVGMASRRLAGSFAWLWASAGSATLADGVYQVALPIAALHLGGGASAVAAVYTAARLPWALFALHAGAVVDRFDRRRLLIGANTVRTAMLVIGVLVVTFRTGGIVALATAAFILGIAETVGDTAMHSITPRVVAKSQLEQANSRLQATELVTSLFVGPSLGGLLAGIALGWAFGSVALLYTAAALAALRLSQPPGLTPDMSGVPRPAQHTTIKDGLAFLFARPRLTAYAVGVGALNVCFSAFQTALPVVALRGGGLGLSDGQYGLLLGVAGITGLVAGLVAPRFLRRTGPRVGMLIGTLGLAVGLAAPGLTTDLSLVTAGLACTGLLVLVNIITVSHRQRVVPDALLGRVTSAYRLLAFGGLPLGSLLAGIMGAHTSPRTVLVAAGVLAVTVGVIMTAATPSRHPQEQAQ